MNEIIKKIEALKIGHYYCEDPWYSCPLAEDGCINEAYEDNECNCNAEGHNKKIDEIIAELRECQK